MLTDIGSFHLGRSSGGAGRPDVDKFRELLSFLDTSGGSELVTTAGSLVAWLIVAVGCWLGYFLVRQNGQILIRLDAIERELVIARIRTFPEREASAQGAVAVQAETGENGGDDPLLSKSRINRSGLTPGTGAPCFTLPRVDRLGLTVSLSDYEARPFVLVFASADCGPCDILLRKLSQLSPGRGERSIFEVLPQPMFL